MRAIPLYVSRRYGNGTNPLQLTERDVNLRRVLQTPDFVNLPGADGFGGPETDFHHNSVRGGVFGALESQPHNIVHVEIGGSDPQLPRPVSAGLMTDPDTAALDPIFWLHHANIDRLWEVWLNRLEAHRNPTIGRWLNGPLDRKLIVPKVDGEDWEFTPQDMLITTASDLNYEYDDILDPLGGGTRFSLRLRQLNVPAIDTNEDSSDMMQQPELPKPQIEIVGTSEQAIDLTGERASARVRLDMKTMEKVNRSFRLFSTPPTAIPEPDRIFLNVENIRSNQDGAVVEVYLNPHRSDNFADYSDYYVGAIAFFGVGKASSAEESHGSSGVTQVFEITELIDRLYLNQELELENIENVSVELVNRREIPAEDNATVGTISIYRQKAERQAE